MPTSALFQTKAPQPAKAKVRIETVGDELHLSWRGGGICAALFLVVWLAGWSAGCGMMLLQLINGFEWFFFLFSIPFFVAWIAVASVLSYLLFGRQHLILSRENLRTHYQVILPFLSRSVPLEEVDRAVADEVFEDDSEGAGRYVGVVRIETIGKPMTFARGIEQAERVWLAEVINVCLDRLAPHREARTEEPELPAVDSEDENLELQIPLDEQAETFELGPELVPRPSESRYQLQREGRSLRFTTRGKWSPAAIAPLTLIMLFWNGIVSVFVMELFRNFEWFLFLFLIPFEVIGMILIAAWLGAIAAPATGRSYSFRLGQIEQTGWFALFRRQKTIVFEELDRLVIDTADARQNSLSKVGKTGPLLESYVLRLVDTQGSTVHEIQGLSRGEARWIADTLLRERPEMFRRR